MVALVRAHPSDIPFVMACERRPDYEPLVGRWTAERHAETLADPNYAYFIGQREGEPIGFTILRDFDAGTDSLYLKRIAVHDAGAGHGRALLAAVTDWVFAETAFHRFWLEVVETNTRAWHVYSATGWSEEGRVREAFKNPDGSRGSYIQLSILKSEWIDRRKSAR